MFCTLFYYVAYFATKPCYCSVIIVAVVIQFMFTFWANQRIFHSFTPLLLIIQVYARVTAPTVMPCSAMFAATLHRRKFINRYSATRNNTTFFIINLRPLLLLYLSFSVVRTYHFNSSYNSYNTDMLQFAPPKI